MRFGRERPEIVRPPSEWRSYYLPITWGCSHAGCAFCRWYGEKLRIRDLEEIEEEIRALSLLRNHGVYAPSLHPVAARIAIEWDGRRIFLQDADALAYPYESLVEILKALREHFPSLERVGSYATPQILLRRSVEQLRKLRELGLGILYVGVESGDDLVLEKVGKGVRSEEIVEACRKVKEAGIALSVTVILGLGGKERSREHALRTAEVLSRIDPEFAAALTLMIVPGTPLEREVQEGRFSLLSPFEILEELKLMLENCDFSSFFSTMHASNYLPLRGRFPQEKGKLLSILEEVLRRRDPGLLRPSFLRAL